MNTTAHRSDETIAKRRRDGVRALIESRFDGNATAFSRAIERSQSQVSDVLTGRKAFGEKFARHVESRLGLGSNALDRATCTVSINVFEVRRENLRRIIDQHFDGRQVAFADAIDRPADYVSRLLSGKKRMGEGFARMVESVMQFASGSLDAADTAGNSQVSSLIRDIESLSERNVRLVRGLVDLLLTEQDES